jgi:hypothetical protein
MIDKKYLNKIKNTKFDPVFIMGLHRSGTTILYEMLEKTEKFNILTAYHVIYYDELLHNHIDKIEEKKKRELNNLLTEKGIINRKTDNVKVSADYAHEYMYIFLEKNLSWKIDEKNKELFEEICKKIKFISKNNKPILLKNPYDFANFVKIKKFYPNAKFIFIHRNPSFVINSTMKLWKTHFLTKNEFLGLYSKRYRNIYNNPLSRLFFRKYYASKFPPVIFDTIKISSKGVKTYLKNIDFLKKEDYVSIKYEDLCEKPNETMNKILKYLDIKTGLDFSKFIKPRKLTLSKEVKFINRLIYKKMKVYFKAFNYEPEK